MANDPTQPYYRGPDGNGRTLPTGNLVEPGGLYMKDDEGALVFQMVTPNAITAQGEITLLDNGTRGTATVYSSNIFQHWEAAKSFKRNSSQLLFSAALRTEAVIDFTINSQLDELTIKLPFQVTQPQGGSSFYLYDVYDASTQLELTHSRNTNPVQNFPYIIETQITGNLFVQYEGKVFEGSLRQQVEIGIIGSPNDFLNRQPS